MGDILYHFVIGLDCCDCWDCRYHCQDYKFKGGAAENIEDGREMGGRAIQRFLEDFLLTFSVCLFVFVSFFY